MSKSLFVSDPSQLAQPRDVSFLKPTINLVDRRELQNITSIGFGKMLAQVSIMVDPRATGVQLRGFGDPTMLEALNVDPRGGHLALDGELPFKEGSSRRGGGFGRGNSFSGNVFHGNVTVGRNISFGNSSVSMSGGMSIINGVIYIDGREVDMDRQILLILTVPSCVDIQTTKKFFGMMGIGGALDGNLIVKSECSTEIFTGDIKSLDATMTGQGSVTVGNVHQSLDLDITGQGGIMAASVGGDFDCNITGQGHATVTSGNTRSARTNITGQGSIFHNGIILGNARVTVTGQGSITLKQVNGKCNPNITGQGYALVNGVTHRMRLGW